MKMKTPSQLRGHAGEMFVCAELMRRGWLAAPTARGSRAFDLLARRADAPVFLTIRVKTGHGSFVWSAKTDGTLFLDMQPSGDFIVIVDLPNLGAPDYYVVPTPTLEGIVQSNHKRWLKTAGKNGHVHQDTRMRTIWIDEDKDKIEHGYAVTLATYHNAWNLLDDSTENGHDRIHSQPGLQSLQSS